jgi:transketolase
VALAAAEQLATEGVRARVVSMPSWELFAAQPQSYRDEVLPPAITARVAIEAASGFGWSRWVGDGGATLTLDGFGASAPAERLFEEFKLTPAHAAELVRSLLSRSST